MEAQVPIIIMTVEDICHMYLQNKVLPYFLTERCSLVLIEVELKQLETDKKLKSKIYFSMGKYMMHLDLLWDLFRRLRKK